MVVAIDDVRTMRLMRLFNEKVGREALESSGVDSEIVDKLDLLGISSIANMIGAIKFAKYYELDENDVVFTVFTDSMELYNSRMRESREADGDYTTTNAAVDLDMLMNTTCENTLELDHYGRKRIHNLKYYTWIEQQGRDLAELNAQWSSKTYWSDMQARADDIDKVITEFNERLKR
jgi:hypothetical protein